MKGGTRKTASVAEVAEFLGGKVLGDGAIRVHRVSSLESATAGDLSFVSDRSFLRLLGETGASAVIVGEDMADATTLPRIVCRNPYAGYAKVAAFLNPETKAEPGVDPRAAVHPGAGVSASATIGPFSVIEEDAVVADGVIIGAGSFIGRGAKIGEHGRLHARTTIYHACVVGARAIIHSGAVIGADGFGMAMDEGRWLKIPQLGRVVIGDDVEIGANTTIDRGAMDDTVIGDGVKLDNQIQIGHNCKIGAHTAIAGCVGIAGSTHIGSHCRLGGSAMIIGHLSIADHVDISAGTLVAKSITQPGTYTAVFPISPHGEWLKNASLIRRLRDMHMRLRELEEARSGSTRRKT